MGCVCSRFGNNSEVSLVIEDIREKYALSNELLGRGSFGQVRTAVEFKTGVVCAVKIIQRDNKVGEWSNEAMFKTEVELIRNLDHTNIIKFYEVYEDPRFLYVVMEKCDGGEVFDKIRELRRFGEWDASNIGRQMLCGLHYIHNLDIVHRDVKAENFLFHTKDISAPLRLIDFGMAKRLVPGEYFTSLCGSPHYLSPELVGQRYQESTDLWSFGVLMYLMLYGRYPFDGNSPEEIMRNILTGVVNWTHSHVHLSPLAILFLKRFLVLDATKRISAKQALVHDWICTRKPDVKPAVLPQEVRAAAHSASKIRFNQNVISSVKDFQQKLSEAEDDYSRGKVGVRIVSHEEKKHMRTWSVVNPRRSIGSSSRRNSTDTTMEEAPVSYGRDMSLPIGRRLSNFMMGRTHKVHIAPNIFPFVPTTTAQDSTRRVTDFPLVSCPENSVHPAVSSVTTEQGISLRSALASSPSISAISNVHSQSVQSRKSYPSDGSARSFFRNTSSSLSGADYAAGGVNVMSGCGALATHGPPSPGGTHIAPPSSPMPGEHSPMPILLGSIASGPNMGDDGATLVDVLEERLKAKCERPASPRDRDGDNLSVSSSTVGTDTRPVPTTMATAPMVAPLPPASQGQGCAGGVQGRAASRDWLVDTPVIEEDEHAACAEWGINGCSLVQSNQVCGGDMSMLAISESADNSIVRSPTVGPIPDTFDGTARTSVLHTHWTDEDAHNSTSGLVNVTQRPQKMSFVPQTQTYCRGGSMQFTDRRESKSTVRRFSLAIQHIFSSSSATERARAHSSFTGVHRRRASNRGETHLTEYLGGISEDDIQEFAAEYARKVERLENQGPEA
eukprot:GEMP01003374.1.p1 GENE.GEMP01003374.1~~GEMP01003374.1.p1  ORF type:complete len:859 (+),score=161.73 GEMP01003374.1:57-2579(+)